MKKATAALALILCLFLSGCGKKEMDAGSLLGQAAGLDDEAPLLTVDGREIPAWKYLYWLAVDCGQLEERYEASGTTLDWSVPLADGSTLEDLVKVDALADTVLYASVDSWAETYGCTLTGEELDNLPKRSYPGLTAEQGQVLAETGRKYAKLYALYETPGSPLAPAVGELELFQQTSGLLAAERLLVPAGDDREAARQRAAALFARLNTAEDQASAFDALLTETGGGPLPEEEWTGVLRDAASALKPGQISGIIETGAGFSILRRLPAEGAALREAYFDSLLQDAAADSDIQFTNAYISLRPAAFWGAVQQTKSITRKQHC